MDFSYDKHLLLSTCSINEETGAYVYQVEDLYYLKDLLGLFNDTQCIAKSESDEFSLHHAQSTRYASLKSTASGKRILLALKRLQSMSNLKGEPRELHPTLTLFRQLADQHAISQHIAMTDNTPEAIAKLAYRLNVFTRQFRAVLNTGPHKLKLRKNQKAAKKNLCGALRYIDSLFAQYARLLVIRVDLSYRNEAKASISAELARHHRERFFKNLQAHRLFRACIGYIWKLEYGRYKGFHYHLLVFYDGARVRQDITLAQLLGEYWRDTITDGAGNYYNCNAYKERYRIPGIGMLHHTDTAKREGLNIAVNYLCKVDTFARLALPGRERTFGRGEIVPLTDIRRGRPRST
ncbi:YagK/YfjJ domain-containing protein [Serratia fonticola]|uniref:YagK/YfjJ domain-containing protein n=1 Tax=Serratia fonticola TaxID=47917 RepID=UPI001644062D|nr:inovirus-type Gp2 protein [Serratia fonticola]MBC3216690.1 inovirus-type Gp2 protein [Serratia fonticola]